eukprot:scaffold27143_cov73-Skeletonema_marinoi.AAC.1
MLVDCCVNTSLGGVLRSQHLAVNIMAEIPSSIARRGHVKRLWQRFQFHCSEVTSTREWRPGREWDSDRQNSKNARDRSSKTKRHSKELKLRFARATAEDVLQVLQFGAKGGSALLWSINSYVSR